MTSGAPTAAGGRSRAAGGPPILRLLIALARADFLERTRRFSSVLTLLGMIFMAWQAMPADPKQFSLSVHLGDYRGVYNSAWVGGILALLVSSLLTLIGFFLIKNAVERDRLTGVGEILASTPISRPAYTLGKTLSNFVFLAALPATLWLAGLGMQLLRGEERHLDPWVMASPLIFICLPVLAIVAALAVLFECVRWLRGTLGNVLYFFLWVFGLTAGILSPIDVLGVKALHASMGAACQARYADYDLTGLVIGGGIDPIKGTFVWNGMAWNGPLLLQRLAWFGAALLIALAAALVFDRFDSARSAARLWSVKARRPSKSRDLPGSVSLEDDAGSRPTARPTGTRLGEGAAHHFTLTPLARGAGHFRLASLVVAELRLMFKGVSRWWTLVMLGLTIAGLAAPAPGGQIVRSLAWIWPIALWAGLGVRDTRHGTVELLLSSPGPRTRQWPATLIAGGLVALLPGAGCLIHAGAVRGVAGLVTAAAGIAFVPAFAFAAGRLSGSSRLFEITYLLLWYIGPLNAVPLFDYTGEAPGLTDFGTAAWLGVVAVGGLAAAALTPDRHR